MVKARLYGNNGNNIFPIFIRQMSKECRAKVKKLDGGVQTVSTRSNIFENTKNCMDGGRKFEPIYFDLTTIRQAFDPFQCFSSTRPVRQRRN